MAATATITTDLDEEKHNLICFGSFGVSITLIVFKEKPLQYEGSYYVFCFMFVCTIIYITSVAQTRCYKLKLDSIRVTAQVLSQIVKFRTGGSLLHGHGRQRPRSLITYYRKRS